MQSPGFASPGFNGGGMTTEEIMRAMANAPDIECMHGMEPLTMMKYAMKMWNFTHIVSERFDKLAQIPGTTSVLFEQNFMESFLDEFRKFWVQDRIHKKLICKDMARVAYVNATESIRDKRFRNARLNSLLGYLSEEWVCLGAKDFVAAFYDKGMKPQHVQARERMNEYIETTSSNSINELGLIRYVSKQMTSCSCLKEFKRDAKDEVKLKADLMVLTCYGCQKNYPEERLKNCARCKLVHYCSKECQRQDWTNGHKGKCKENCLLMGLAK
jgi:hypothetical protein